MSNVVGHLDVGHPEIANSAGTILIVVVMLLVAGAVGLLLAALPLNEYVIAHDMANSFLMVP